MTAVDRITAIVADHALYADDERDVCKCEWEPDYEQIDFTANALIPAHEHVNMLHARHVAERIAAADDLAVIELPKPSAVNRFIPDEPVTQWTVKRGFGVSITQGYKGIDLELPDVLGNEGARKAAAALLAAAKATEAVSDR